MLQPKHQLGYGSKYVFSTIWNGLGAHERVTVCGFTVYFHMQQPEHQLGYGKKKSENLISTRFTPIWNGLFAK